MASIPEEDRDAAQEAQARAREAQVAIEGWRRHYNHVRPHVSLGYRAPAPEVFVPALASSRLASPPAQAVASRPLMH